MINNNIEDLEVNFKEKVKLFIQEAKATWLDIIIFEWLRSLERQKYLYSIWRTIELNKKPITWTLQSNHLTWKAVDIVFKDKNWNPSWSWDYDTLIWIANKYWINNLKPKETCHFECNWIPLISKNKIMEDIRQSAIDFCNRWYMKNENMKENLTKEDFATIIERVLVKNVLK